MVCGPEREGDDRIIGPFTNWWTDTLISLERGVEIVRKRVTISGVDDEFVRRYYPEQAEEIIARKTQIIRNCTKAAYLNDLFSRVYDYAHTTGGVTEYKATLIPYAFWSGTDLHQGKYRRWNLGGIRGEPEVWYDALGVTLFPLWERIPFYKDEITKELDRDIARYAGNQILTNRKILDFRAVKDNIIEQKILGGVLIGLELVDPTPDPALIFRDFLKHQREAGEWAVVSEAGEWTAARGNEIERADIHRG